MTPLFCSWLEIGTVSPLRVLDRLAKEGIAVYGVRKCSPVRLKIRVKSKELQKIFAILQGSCYTVKKAEESFARRLLRRALSRPGFAAGLALFFVLAAASNFFVLRVDFVGSGARYRERAAELLAMSGIRLFAPYAEEAAETARGALMTLPGIVFASVEKRGSSVTVTLEEEAEAPEPSYARSLFAPAAGEVEELVVLRGTALVGVGDAVAAGQELVAGRFETEAGGGETFAVARCTLVCTHTYALQSAEQSEQASRRALAIARLRAGGEPVREEISVRAEGDAFVYTVTLAVRVRCAVNMGGE